MAAYNVRSGSQFATDDRLGMHMQQQKGCLERPKREAWQLHEVDCSRQMWQDDWQLEAFLTQLSLRTMYRPDASGLQEQDKFKV